MIDRRKTSSPPISSAAILSQSRAYMNQKADEETLVCLQVSISTATTCAAPTARPPRATMPTSSSW